MSSASNPDSDIESCGIATPESTLALLQTEPRGVRQHLHFATNVTVQFLSDCDISSVVRLDLDGVGTTFSEQGLVERDGNLVATHRAARDGWTVAMARLAVRHYGSRLREPVAYRFLVS